MSANQNDKKRMNAKVANDQQLFNPSKKDRLKKIEKTSNNIVRAEDRLEKRRRNAEESNSPESKRALECFNLIESEMAALFIKNDPLYKPSMLTRCVELFEQAFALAPKISPTQPGTQP